MRDEHHRESDIDGEQRIVMGDDHIGVQRERSVRHISSSGERNPLETLCADTIRDPERGRLPVQTRVVERIDVQAMQRISDVRTSATGHDGDVMLAAQSISDCEHGVLDAAHPLDDRAVLAADEEDTHAG